MTRIKIGTLMGGGHQNLLDNWYFGDPINQKALTVYESTVSGFYTLDRWGLWTTDCKLEVLNGYIKVSPINNRKDASLYQAIEKPPIGVPITVSALTKDGELVTGTATAAQNSSSTGQKCHFDSKNKDFYIGFHRMVADGLARFFFCAYENKVMELVAVKAELGEEQTLAEQNADGSWRLRDLPPNKAIELLKCQRYCFVIGGNVFTMLPNAEIRGYASATKKWTYYMSVPLPTPMRATPALKIQSTRSDTSIVDMRYGPLLCTVKSDDEQFSLLQNNFGGNFAALSGSFTKDDTNNIANSVHTLVPWISPNVRIILDANI